MHGNVREWVEDCWHDSYRGAPVDGRPWLEENGGECRWRVYRGGSWQDGPGGLGSAGRLRDHTGSRFNNLGFRVARTLR